MVTPWSKEEDNVLIELYNKVPVEELTKVLIGRTGSAIRKHATGVLRIKNNLPKIDNDYLTILRREVEG